MGYVRSNSARSREQKCYPNRPKRVSAPWPGFQLPLHVCREAIRLPFARCWNNQYLSHSCAQILCSISSTSIPVSATSTAFHQTIHSYSRTYTTLLSKMYFFSKLPSATILLFIVTTIASKSHKSQSNPGSGSGPIESYCYCEDNVNWDQAVSDARTAAVCPEALAQYAPDGWPQTNVCADHEFQRGYMKKMEERCGNGFNGECCDVHGTCDYVPP